MTQLALSFPKPVTYRCVVCGVVATSKKIVFDGLQSRRVVIVCREHEAICRMHMVLDCKECAP